MSQKIKNKNSLPRVKIVQKIYNLLMNPVTQVEYPKSQYKKFIKDVVEGTIERDNVIDDEISKHLSKDIKLKNLDKVFQIILKSGIFEFMYKPKTPVKIIIKEYLNASNYFLDVSQTKYLNALLDKISKKIRNLDE